MLAQGETDSKMKGCHKTLRLSRCPGHFRLNGSKITFLNIKQQTKQEMLWRRASLRKLPVQSKRRSSCCSTTASCSPASDTELLAHSSSTLQLDDCRERLHTEPVMPSALFKTSGAPLRISSRSTYNEEVCCTNSSSSINTFQIKQRQRQQLTVNCVASSFRLFNEQLASVASTDACEGDSFSAEFNEYDERLSGEVFDLEL
jgi:hypothetical protein